MLRNLQGALMRILNDEDPVATLREEAEKLPEKERGLLESIGEDGLRLTGLILQKLRFERICRGNPEISAWFDRDPGAFLEAFREYSKSVPPRYYFPEEETSAFSLFLSQNKISMNQSPPEDVKGA